MPTYNTGNLTKVIYNGINCTKVFYTKDGTTTTVFNFASFPQVTSSVTPVEIGDFRIYTFTSDGTFEVTQEGNDGGANTYRLLLVGGGGQVGLQETGFGGGAGAGGMVEEAAYALPLGSYDIRVGIGPNTGDNDPSENGGNSTIGSITALTAFGGGARSSGGFRCWC